METCVNNIGFVELFSDSNIDLPKDKIREGLNSLEQLMLENKIGNGTHFIGNTDNCPLKPSFSDGIYVREILIPRGTLITGRIHKHHHHSFLLSGKAVVLTEEKGKEILEAPLTIISAEGTKRAILAITDLILVTVHANPTNKKNVEELEEMIFADNYLMFDKFIEKKKSVLSKLKRKIINNLSL